jgi:hypothetical protein
MPRVRQKLALVVGLRERFDEAETIARRSAAQPANVACLRQMLATAEPAQVAGVGVIEGRPKLRLRHVQSKSDVVQ